MQPDAPLDPDQVHHLDVPAGGRGRLPFLLLVIGLLALAGAGAWVVLAEPFAGPSDAPPPPPAADNLLADAWSFETTESSSAAAAWFVPEDAPAGFTFVPQAAVSGALGASASTNQAGWSRILSRQLLPVDQAGEVFEIGASSKSASIQLSLRFEFEQRSPLDLVLASGVGDISGRTQAPAGASGVRAGVGCVGSGQVDDVLLRRLPGTAWQPLASEKQGVYDISLGTDGLLSIRRDRDLALRLGPLSLVLSDGTALPVAAAWLPGETALALPDGSRVGLSLRLDRGSQPEQSARAHPLLEIGVSGAPQGARLAVRGLIAGSLANSPVGLLAGSRYDLFTEDFHEEGIESLVLGRTQDRLVIGMGGVAAVKGSHPDDEHVSLSLELPLTGDEPLRLSIEAGFHEQRLEARGLLDQAEQANAAGARGEALVLLDRIVQELPYDQELLEQARKQRAELQLTAKEKLEALRSDLDDAVFLENPDRCRDVREVAYAALEAWSASESQRVDFAAFAREVEQRAGPILSRVDDRRRRALQARLDSFAADGRFPEVVAEMREALERLDEQERSP